MMNILFQEIGRRIEALTNEKLDRLQQIDELQADIAEIDRSIEGWKARRPEGNLHETPCPFPQPPFPKKFDAIIRLVLRHSIILLDAVPKLGLDLEWEEEHYGPYFEPLDGHVIMLEEIIRIDRKNDAQQWVNLWQEEK